MAEPYVFISYSRRDRNFVKRLASTLRAEGVQTWTDVESIPAGANWQREIEKGLLSASVLIYVASKNSVSSQWMDTGLQTFLGTEKRLIPIVIDDEGASHLPLPLRQIQWADFRGDYGIASHRLLEAIQFLRRDEPVEHPSRKSKGYVFVSYADEDSHFVEQLKVFLRDHGYAYWDFRESERNYDIDYSLELEGIIKDAAGTLSIISPNWKQSQISMQEFHFSRDVGTPVFLLKVGEPGPTLVLSGRTYIDFTREREKGFTELDRELRRKGL